MSRATFTHTVSTASAPSDLWQALQQPQVWSAITGIDHVHQPRFDGDGLLTGFQFSATVGGRSYSGAARVTDRSPSRRLVLAIETTDLDGVISIVIDSGSSTAVTLTMDTGPRSFAARMAFSLIRSAIESGFTASAEQFVAQLEASQTS